VPFIPGPDLLPSSSPRFLSRLTAAVVGPGSGAPLSLSLSLSRFNVDEAETLSARCLEIEWARSSTCLIPSRPLSPHRRVIRRFFVDPPDVAAISFLPLPRGFFLREPADF
jgi:hypothetical protein